MTEIIITDKPAKIKNLLYLQKSLAEILRQTGSTVRCYKERELATLEIGVSEFYKELMLSELADKIADVIVVGYKYDFLKDKIKPCGLTENERELFLAGIISADLVDDKRYVTSKLKGFERVAIDGFYNFRLKLLKEKWSEIASFMPTAFFSEQLKEFLSFISADKKGRIYIEGESVYDEHYRKLIKGELLPNNSLISEVILSGAGEINLLEKDLKVDVELLKNYYGNRIIFLNNKI